MQDQVYAKPPMLHGCIALFFNPLTGKQHDKAVEAERDAAVRRRPHLEALQQVAKLGARLGRRQPYRVKHRLLHISSVDAEAAACVDMGLPRTKGTNFRPDCAIGRSSWPPSQALRLYDRRTHRRSRCR